MLAGNVDVSLGIDTSVFDRSLKDSSKRLQETFGLNAKQAKSVATLEHRLMKQAETFGMTATEAEIYKLQMQGIAPDALATVKAIDAQIKSLQREEEEMAALDRQYEAFAKRGAQVFDATRTKAERYEKELAELDSLLRKGVIDQDTFNRAVKQLDPPDAKVSKFRSALAGAGSSLSSFGSGLASLGKAAAIGFAGLVAGATGAAGGLALYARSALTAVDETGDLASRLGVSVHDLTSLQHATQMLGGSAEDLGPALGKLQANLGDVASKGAGPTADALKRLGLDAQAVAKMGAGDALKAIAGGFQSIKNPAEQSALAMDLAGKGGLSLVNLLKSGPAEIEKFQKQADLLGKSFTNADAEAAGAFNDTIDNVGAVIGGLGRKIAGGLAPVVTDVGNRFIEWATTSLDTGKLVNVSLDLIAKGAAYVADVINGIQVIWHAVVAGVRSGAAYFLDGLNMLAKGIETLINKIPGVEVSFGTTISDMSKELHKLAGEDWNKAKQAFDNPPGSKITDYFENIRKSAEDAAKSINKAASETKKSQDDTEALAGAFTALRDDLKKQVDTFGLTEAEKRIAEFKKLGASQGQLQELSKLQGTLDAKNLLEKLKTPEEKFKKELADLEALKAGGFISGKDFAKAQKGLNNEFFGDKTANAGGALTVGSKEERSALLAFNGAAKNDGIKGVEKNTAETNTLLQAIKDKLPGVSLPTKPTVEVVRI